ncbi:uncharacterized protein [Nicotiana sylvestris]|uniref:uncharacterized protein n=1 Tax=Nicotiana sylvestris TaxID=4096 RepID=UPI00388CD7BE
MGTGIPLLISRYCNQLRGAGGKKELLMAYFGESLVSIASEWYMDQDISRWHIWDDLARDFASRVKPPMDEIEMVTVFLQAQEADYFQNMMSAMGKPFAEAIKIGEMVENGLKTSQILSQSAIRATSQAIQGGSRGVANRKKKKETSMATSSARKPRPPRSFFSKRVPQHYYPHQDVAYAPQPYTVMNAQPYVRPQQQFNQNKSPLPRNQPPYPAHYNPRPPQNNFRARESLRKMNFTPIVLKAIIAIANVEKKSKAAPKQDKGEKKNKTTPPKSEKKIEVEPGATPTKDVVLYVPRGHKEKQMTLSPPRRFELNKITQIYVPKGTYVMRGPINPPRLSEPVVIGRTPQKPMTDPAAVPWNYNKSVVTYKGKEISGEVQENNPTKNYFNLEEVNNATRKRFPYKKPVSPEEAEAFFQKMKMADYEVIDQLQKSPAQVSLLSLLMNSTEHQKVLIKTFNEAYVPVETSVEQLERMAERFFAIN